MLILAHGLGCDRSIWSAVAPALAREFRVVTFDHAGCGDAAPDTYDPVRHASLAGYADDLRAIVEALAEPRPILVGHSISGSIAILAEATTPGTFSALVLLAPSPRFLDDPATGYQGGLTPADVDQISAVMAQNLHGWAESFARVVAPPPEGANRMVRAFIANDPDRLRAFARVAFTHDVRAELPRVHIPARVLACRDDAIVSLAVSRGLAEALPYGTLRILDVVGHCPHVTDPELTIAAIREYLTG